MDAAVMATPGSDAAVADGAPAILDSAPADVFGGIVTLAMFESGSNPCGLAYDHVAGRVWVYPCFGADILGFLPDSTASTPAARGGEMADDVDVDIAPKAFMLGQTLVAEGDLLFINGETAVADIHVVNKQNGMTSMLATAFGGAHVVGGAYHAGRNSFFLVQDRVPGAQDGNRVAEIDLTTGQVLGSFQTTPDFVVNFGDLDVCQSTGHLFVVSSAERTIAEFTTQGTLVNKHPLPAGVTGAAGIDMNNSTGEAWIAGTNGTVWRLSVPCGPYGSSVGGALSSDR